MKWYEKILLLPKRMLHFLKKIVTFSKRQQATLPHQSKDLQEPSPQILPITIDTLLIKTFYEILKTGNKRLLSEKASEKQLNNTWDELLDRYWQATNPAKYKTNLRRMMIEAQKLNKFTTVRAGIMLAELGQTSGIETLKAFGITSVERAYGVLRVMETNAKIKLAKENNEEAKAQAFNFYKDLSMLEQILNRSLDPNKIVVAQWIELVKIADAIGKESKKGKQNGRN